MSLKLASIGPVIFAIALSACTPNSREAGNTDSGNVPPPVIPTATAPVPIAPQDAEAAITSFQQQALAAVPPSISSNYRDDTITAINNRKRLHARRTTCQECFRRIDGTLSPGERRSLVLHGSIDDLKTRTGECWVVESGGTERNDISGYIDATSGKLIVLWIIPEG